jgi:TPR repeat protein
MAFRSDLTKDFKEFKALKEGKQSDGKGDSKQSVGCSTLPAALQAHVFAFNTSKDLFLGERGVCHSFFNTTKNNLNLLRTLYKQEFGFLPFDDDIENQLKAAQLFRGEKFSEELMKHLKSNEGKPWTFYYLGRHSRVENDDEESALKYFCLGLDKGDFRAAQQLFSMGMEGGDNNILTRNKINLIPCLLLNLNRGYKIALFFIGKIFARGLGVPKNEKLGEEYLKRSLLEDKHTPAAIEIMQMHFKYRPLREVKAEEFQKEMQELERLVEETKLGELAYHTGEWYYRREVPEDYKEEKKSDYVQSAYRAYHRAFELGCMESAYMLAEMTMAGNGVEQDSMKAKQYAEIAFANGNAEAAFLIANSIEIANLLGTDEEVESWYQRGALLGNKKCWTALCRLYTGTENWEKDPKKIAWLIYGMTSTFVDDYQILLEVPIISALWNGHYNEEYNLGVMTDITASHSDIDEYYQLCEQEGLMNDTMKQMFANAKEQAAAKDHRRYSCQIL